MKTLRYFLLFAILITICKSDCRSIAELLQEYPCGFYISPEGVLKLSHHEIDSLEGLELVPEIERVRKLSLAHNKLTGLNDRAFAMMPHLRILKLKDNHIATVGDNLFHQDAIGKIDIYLYNNPLSFKQIYKLMSQVYPNDNKKIFAMVDYLLNQFLERFKGKTDIAKLSNERASLFIGAASVYLVSKLICMHPRLAKANLVLDSLVHGANVIRFLMGAIKRPRAVSVDDGLNLLENGVHLHNTFRNPSTIHGFLQAKTGYNLNSVTKNPYIWAGSLLPWARLLRAPSMAQDLMMAPWALCPSKISKLIEGARGAITIANWLWPRPPRLGMAIAQAVRVLPHARGGRAGNAGMPQAPLRFA